MDEILFPGGNRRRKRRGKKRDAGPSPQEDLFPVERASDTSRRTAPFQATSETSRDAAARIADKSEDHKAICYRAIVRATRYKDYITRKEIAAAHFDNQQNYVTGRVHDLIHKDKLVYEKPLRINGVISRDAETGDYLREKRDGSALLVASEIEPLEDLTP